MIRVFIVDDHPVVIEGLHALLQKEILGLIAECYTNPQIAEKIFLSQFTVDTHRKNLLAKLNVKNTATLIKVAVERGLI